MFDDVREIKELKILFKAKAQEDFRNEVLSRFKEFGLTVEQVELEGSDYDSIYLIQGVPLQIDLRQSETLSFLDEEHWMHKIKGMTVPKIKMLLRDTPTGLRYDTVDEIAEEIKIFLKDHPLYTSEKLADMNNKSGVFEHVKTFENWRDSEILRKANNATGVFEEENEKDGEEWVNDCFIDHNHETAEIIADEGKMKVGVIYETEDPSEDKITIELSDVPPQTGYITISVKELRNLLQTAYAQLDNFPKII